MATIYLTSSDFARLKKLIDDSLFNESGDQQYFERLKLELDQAEIRDPQDIPKDVITMNSKVRLKDMDSNEVLNYTLVYPAHANASMGRISILAPIGTAMIGSSVGDVIEWAVPAGTRRLKIEDVVYQPEASGDSLL